MSFFDPLLTSDGQPYARAKFKEIITEQVILSYLTKGGVTYGDTQQMTPYERQLAADAIQKFLKEQAEAQEEAIKKNMKNR